jgi:hypothetical protein
MIYEIISRVSGQSLGKYSGKNEMKAYDAMCRDAGYKSAAACAETLGESVAEAMSELSFVPRSKR